jgi:ribonuclease-3
VTNDSWLHAFTDRDLLRQALTHRSVGPCHNERLEFLGDALVNLFVADALYRRWPKADEGALTRARAELVRESALATVSRTLGIGERLLLGPGELKSGGHRRDSILADALEALIAAIYLDAGYAVCRDVVLPWFQPGVDALPSGKVGKDAKTRVQEWLQARQLPLPEYELIETMGEEHQRTFRIRAGTGNPAWQAEGVGSSRRAGEQQAAAALLEQLEQSGKGAGR